ncbi:hypothetical protein NPIL_562511 [Nephila pilipes]|uniref:Uncharacterized protein n=1 Tax=Nephila pilipes TaxID=299642 RepID=A0A8X6THS0_NEPPI|nr:hypothetical protein NPIL_562511 [Nephila pilipes]
MSYNDDKSRNGTSLFKPPHIIPDESFDTQSQLTYINHINKYGRSQLKSGLASAICMSSATKLKILTTGRLQSCSLDVNTQKNV